MVLPKLVLRLNQATPQGGANKGHARLDGAVLGGWVRVLPGVVYSRIILAWTDQCEFFILS